MWWNIHRYCGAPILVALVAGDAALRSEQMSNQELQEAAMKVSPAAGIGAAYALRAAGYCPAAWLIGLQQPSMLCYSGLCLDSLAHAIASHMHASSADPLPAQC